MLKGALKSVSFLWAGSIIGAGLAFLVQVITARSLTADQFGSISATLAIIAATAPLAAFGVPQYWLRVFGEEGMSAIRWIKPSIRFSISTTSTVIAALIIWAFAASHSPQVRDITIILIPMVVSQACIELMSAKLQLEERYSTLAKLQLLPNLLRFLGVSAVAISPLSESSGLMTYIAMAYACTAIFFIIPGITEIKKLQSGKINLIGHTQKQNLFTTTPSTVDISRSAFPFGVAASFHIIYFQGSLIFLNYLVSTKDSGLYNCAFVVMSAIYILPNVIYQKFLTPKIHRWACHNRDLFESTFKKGCIGMITAGLISTTIIFLAAPIAIPTLFGEQYIGAIPVLQALSICAPIRFLATCAGSVLTTKEHMKKKALYMGIVALSSIALHLTITKTYGLSGALASTIASEILLLILYIYAARYHVFKR